MGNDVSIHVNGVRTVIRILQLYICNTIFWLWATWWRLFQKRVVCPKFDIYVSYLKYGLICVRICHSVHILNMHVL